MDPRNHITAAATAIWVNGGGNDELEEHQAVWVVSALFWVVFFSDFFQKNNRLETRKPHIIFFGGLLKSRKHLCSKRVADSLPIQRTSSYRFFHTAVEL